MTNVTKDLNSKSLYVSNNKRTGAFNGRFISRNGYISWPPSSCDLTPLDSFLSCAGATG